MGRPKAWLPVGGEFMLARVARLLRGAVEPVVVVAAQGQDLPPLPGDIEVVRDEQEGQGPLGGLAAGLTALAGRCDAAYLSACDAPFLRAAFVRAVVRPVPVAAVPRVGGRLHPLAAVYRVEVLPAVRAMLARGERRMTALFELVPARVIEADELRAADPELASLRNLNTPEEYAATLRELAAS
jgi:molybdopterin-guanine dinucleotide biosynthesis protein A